MNHIVSEYTAPDGIAYRSHAWELREGGYRRLALVFGYPFWPIAREKRLINFLMDRGFRVHALELAFGSPTSPWPSLVSARTAAAAYAAEIQGRLDLPLYLLASSFSCSLVDPSLRMIETLAAVALIAPVLEYPPPGLKMPRCFLSRKASLELGRESLSGKPELLDEVIVGALPVLWFSKRDLRELAGDPHGGFLGAVGSPLAAFAGEEDPLLSPGARERLAAGGAKIYGYPRTRHAPAFDRYADNFFVDLGSFFDEVESRKRS